MRRCVLAVLLALEVVACTGVQRDPGLIGRDCDRIRERVERLEDKVQRFEREAVDDSRGPPGSRTLSEPDKERLRQLRSQLREVRSRICH
jgi:hypothetical protein